MATTKNDLVIDALKLTTTGFSVQQIMDLTLLTRPQVHTVLYFELKEGKNGVERVRCTGSNNVKWRLKQKGNR